MTELLASAPHRLKARLPIALDGDPVVDRQAGYDRLLGVVARAHVVLALHEHHCLVVRRLEDVLQGNGILATRPELHPVEILGEVRRQVTGIVVQ